MAGGEYRNRGWGGESWPHNPSAQVWLLSNLWIQHVWSPLGDVFAVPFIWMMFGNSFKGVWDEQKCCQKIQKHFLEQIQVGPIGCRGDHRDTAEEDRTIHKSNATQDLETTAVKFLFAQLFLCDVTDAYQGICCSQTCRVFGHTSPSGCRCSHMYTTRRSPHWSYWHSWVSWACLSQTPRWKKHYESRYTKGNAAL